MTSDLFEHVVKKPMPVAIEACQYRQIQAHSDLGFVGAPLYFSGTFSASGEVGAFRASEGVVIKTHSAKASSKRVFSSAVPTVKRKHWGKAMGAF